MRGLMALAAILAAIPAIAKDTAELQTDLQKFSYTVGYQLGRKFEQQGIGVDADVIARAIQDAQQGKQPALGDAEMHKAAQAVETARLERRSALAAKNQKQGDAFLAENAQKEGVVSLENGIQYKVLEKGSGKSPKASDTVVANYEGPLVDGSVFDSSYKRGQPATFPLAKVIPGWREVLPLMTEGAKWRVVLPPEQAYGAQGRGSKIGPNATLVFDIELLEVK